ncbi:hypothetical protein AB0D99_04320 [Streptomyces sp. NPDC047971]|uniref:hypothetical protein n=1 Tax=Streptomyces sp. NPDC047971 TaxID=3154499 RepID=UPI0033DD1452
MRKRHVRKLLRAMASGEPVRLTFMTTTRGRARLALVAEQFGYAYADLSLNGSSTVLSLDPDPTPRARARAAENRARYPRAGEGRELPPIAPEDVDLLEARMVVDLGRRYSTTWRLGMAAVVTVLLAEEISTEYGDGVPDAPALAGIACAVLAALVVVLFPLGFRSVAKRSARLRAAGFTAVTDANGRLRYLPPGGRLPGHTDPPAPSHQDAADPAASDRTPS